MTNHLEDCVLQAVIAAYRQEPRDEVRRPLMRHRDQRFRFNYVLCDGGEQRRRPDVLKAHRATVKALSRGFAVMNQDEYQHLQLVGNLQAWLQDRAWLMLQSPVDWAAGESSVYEKQAVYDELANRLSERLLDLATRN